MSDTVGMPRRYVELQEKRVREALHMEGYNSYIAGIGYDECPPFIDSDMAVDWRLGWHHAHEIHYRHRPAEAISRASCPSLPTGMIHDHSSA